MADTMSRQKRGRPTDYRPEYAEQAERLCRLLGATDKDLAEFFGKSEQTINAWKKTQPEFLEALKRGKMLSDANVADKLYQRAMGYSHDAVKIMVVGGEVQQVPYIEHYPPDTTACIFWLKNRQREKWRDKPEDNQPNDEMAAMFAQIFDRLPN